MKDALHVAGGVTDAVDARLAQGGLLAVAGPTALDVRTGVMAGPGSTALITGTSTTGTMTVQVGVHVAVGSRGAANGPYLGPTLEAPTTVPIAAAPASGSRIDVVYAKQNDPTSGVPSPDAGSGPVYGVVTGTASSSPTKPALPVGATELGTVQIAAGTTSTNGAGATITNTATQVVARGARIPVFTQAERDALAPFPGLEVYRLDTGAIEVYSAASAGWLTVFNPTWVTYTPTWTSAGTGAATPTVGNGTLVGRYRKLGTLCEVDIFLRLGTTSYGGYDAYRFALPFTAAAGRDQQLLVKSFSQAGDHVGYGLIVSGATVTVPYLPVSNTASNLAPAQNANAANGAATGIPFVSGTYPYKPGHVLSLSGRYETAS